MSLPSGGSFGGRHFDFNGLSEDDGYVARVAGWFVDKSSLPYDEKYAFLMWMMRKLLAMGDGYIFPYFLANGGGCLDYDEDEAFSGFCASELWIFHNSKAGVRFAPVPAYRPAPKPAVVAKPRLHIPSPVGPALPAAMVAQRRSEGAILGDFDSLESGVWTIVEVPAASSDSIDLVTGELADCLDVGVSEGFGSDESGCVSIARQLACSDSVFHRAVSYLSVKAEGGRGHEDSFRQTARLSAERSSDARPARLDLGTARGVAAAFADNPCLPCEIDRGPLALVDPQFRTDCLRHAPSGCELQWVLHYLAAMPHAVASWGVRFKVRRRKRQPCIAMWRCDHARPPDLRALLPYRKLPVIACNDMTGCACDKCTSPVRWFTGEVLTKRRICDWSARRLARFDV